LSRVLDGYERQERPQANFEVIVVADAATPNRAAVEGALAGFSYPTRLLTADLPGASASRNVGWRAARGELVLFTDDDTVPRRDLVAEHVSWHWRFPADEVAVLGLVRWARGIGVTPFMRWLEHGFQFDYHSISGVEASWAHVYSANLSVKRTLLERTGGYGEQELPYLYEDLDWGYRARAHGLQVMFNRGAVVDHWRSTTVADWQARAGTLATAEWRFHMLHPDVPPWFLEKFSEAVARPPARGRAARLARIVPRRTPWLGPMVWRRADLYWRQQIGAQFLAAWNTAATGHGRAAQPAVSASDARSDHSGGSWPAGP
jgi:GT2 family glycosyltransferase